MAVPEFQTFILPLLKYMADHQEHKSAEATDRLADDLGLSEQDRSELLASGIQTRLRNRVSWAFIYLERAKLLERVARGRSARVPMLAALWVAPGTAASMLKNIDGDYFGEE